MVKPIITIFAATLISSASALTLTKNDEVARDAAVQWLQLVDAGRLEEAASQGSTEVRSFDQWLNHFKTQRADLGRIGKRQFIDLKHTAIISGVPEVRRYNVIRFRSLFQNSPRLVEEIVLSKIGCCWEIFQYKIAPVERRR